LKEKKPFYYLPDMDFGAKMPCFADFFGIKTATVTALSRLAEITECPGSFRWSRARPNRL